jgi:hypothetical protein
MKQINGKGNEAAKQLVDYLKTMQCSSRHSAAHPSIALGCSVKFPCLRWSKLIPCSPVQVTMLSPSSLISIEDKNGNVLESFCSTKKRSHRMMLTAQSVKHDARCRF